MDTLASRVAYLRQSSGLAPSALSLLAGLSSGHVGMVERGLVADISTATAQAICRVTGASPAWLLLGEGHAPAAVAVRAVAEDARNAAATAAKGGAS